MRKKKPVAKSPESFNPVAKYAARFHRAEVFRDKTEYRRKDKHRGREPALMGSIRTHESRPVLQAVRQTLSDRIARIPYPALKEAA